MAKAVIFGQSYSNVYGAAQTIDPSSVDLVYNGQVSTCPDTATCGFVSFWYKVFSPPSASTFLMLGGETVTGPTLGGIVGACCPGVGSQNTKNGVPAFQVYFEFVPSGTGGSTDTFLCLALNAVNGGSVSGTFNGILEVPIPIDGNWHHIALSWNVGGNLDTNQTRVPFKNKKNEQVLNMAYWTAGEIPPYATSLIPYPTIRTANQMVAWVRVDTNQPQQLTCTSNQYSLLSATIHNKGGAIGGSGTAYSTNEIVTLVGGTPIAPKAGDARSMASLRIDDVDSSGGGNTGAVTKISYENNGLYSAIPSNPVSTAPTGSGQGAMFTVDVQWSNASQPFTVNFVPATRWDIGYYPLYSAPFNGNLAQLFVYLSDYYVDLVADYNGTQQGVASPLFNSLLQGWNNFSPNGYEIMDDNPALFLNGPPSTFVHNYAANNGGMTFTPSTTSDGDYMMKNNTLTPWASNRLAEGSDDPFIPDQPDWSPG